MKEGEHNIMRGGKYLEDTYKVEKINEIYTCPHCKKLIGITMPITEMIEESEEIPLYTGNCVDCNFLDLLTKKEIIEFEGEEFIATCKIQGNVNPIHFTKKDLENRRNFIAENFCIRGKNPEPSGYKYYCYAFKKRDKKIDLDKL